MATYIEIVEDDADIRLIRLRYKEDTVCQFWVLIWVRWRGQHATQIGKDSTTGSQLLQGIVLNLKSHITQLGEKSEMNFETYSSIFIGCLSLHRNLTSSTIGSAWSGLEQQFHFHTLL